MLSTRTAPLLGLALATAAASGCAHAPRREVAASVAALRCEDAGERVARRPRVGALDGVRLFFTTPLSYAAAGVAWVGDGAAVGAVASIGGVMVCAPLAAVEGALHGDGSATGECIGDVAGAIASDGPLGIGRGVYRATRAWRCPDHVQLAREVRAVARCYALRGAPGDAELARLHLLELREDRGIWTCLPPGERTAVDAELEALRDVLTPPAPPPGVGSSTLADDAEP